MYAYVVPDGVVSQFFPFVASPLPVWGGGGGRTALDLNMTGACHPELRRLGAGTEARTRRKEEAHTHTEEEGNTGGREGGRQGKGAQASKPHAAAFFGPARVRVARTS